jgi:hypothetical protein
MANWIEESVNASARRGCLLASMCLFLSAAPVHGGDRLEWTGATTEIEGSAGGGLVPWALIGGLETNDQVGASAFATYNATQDFSLRSLGVSLDLYDRLEASLDQQRFDAPSVSHVGSLGQDIFGLKLRILGDAVFAPDRVLPQVSLGAQYKHTLNFDDVPHSVGAARAEDIDLYLAASKLYFAAIADRDVLVDVTLRRTRANQFGLLGFGGDGSGYSWVPECSIALFLQQDLLLGAEYRAKPDNLHLFHEDSAEDLFLSWAPRKNVELTGGVSDLGRIAGKSQQRGLYLSLWVGI